MSFLYGFFNAKNLDRVYTAEDFSTYLSSLICNGILDTYGDNFKVSYKSGKEITIGTGKAWISGHYFVNDTEYVLDLSPYVDSSLNRHVTIAICCDVSEAVRDCHLEIIPGTPANNPYPTFPENDEHRTYLTLATVHLWAASSSPVQENLIVDYRADEGKCGYCKCILGKCKVSEMLDQMTQILIQLTNYNQNLTNLQKAMDAVKRRLGMIDYPFPDANGDGTVDASDTPYITEFSALLGAGAYAEYDTIQEKWAAYAAEQGLENSTFPDANADGNVDSSDSALILSFAAEVGAGQYPGTPEGFTDFMRDNDNAIFGTNINKIRVMLAEDYEKSEKRADTLYIITDVVTSGQCGANVFYTLYDGGKVVLTGTGDTYDYDISTNKSPFMNDKSLKSLIVSEGITGIGAYLFRNTNNLESAVLPSTLKQISNAAFMYGHDLMGETGGLKHVVIPEGVTTIEWRAFCGDAIEEITIPESVTEVGNYVFDGCARLKTVHIKNTVIGNFMFPQCTALSNVTVSAKLQKIGENVFTYCTALTTITFEGTTQQWNDVQKGTNWDGKSGQEPGVSALSRVQCTDGYFEYSTESRTWNEVKT